MRINGSTFLTALMSFACLFLGLVTLVYGISGTIEAFSATRWPATQGRVVIAQVKEMISSENELTYGADIRYEYVVDGANLLGRQISSADYSTSNPKDAERLIARYPVGQTVDVFYNPQKPENAMLEPGFKFGLLLWLVFGLIFSLAGIFLCWRFYMGVISGRFRFLQPGR